MNAERARELQDRAKHLTAIKNTPSWPVVRDLVQAKFDAHLRTFLALSDVTDTKLHYGRGYLQGMRVMLMMVENGEKAYEDAVAAARALEGAEGE